MGQTINHLSAVLVPTLGGLLWRVYGYQATFLAGAAIAPDFRSLGDFGSLSLAGAVLLTLA